MSELNPTEMIWAMKEYIGFFDSINIFFAHEKNVNPTKLNDSVSLIKEKANLIENEES